MERRRESRFKISKLVKLKVLGRMAGPSLGRPMDAAVVDISGSGMRLRLTMPVPCGAPVEVDDSHMMLLGEVCRCAPEHDGYYTVGLRVFETLVAADMQECSFRTRS